MARLDHLGYQLEEGVRSEVVGMAILHASPAHPVRLAGMVSRRPAARLALLVSLCGGGGGGQARPSRLPAGGGCEVLGGGHGDTARFSCSSCAARWYGLEKAQGKF